MTQQATVSTEPQHIRISDIVARHGEPPWHEALFTDGRNNVGLICDAPGLENDAHLHPDFNEWWIVLQGEVVWEIGDYPQVTARTGDVVILNTGWQALAANDPEKFMSGEPGLGVGGAEYLAGLGVVAIGADTWGVEVQPSEKSDEVFPVHQTLLAKNGVYILENMKTDELIADEAWEFLFVLGQPKFVGAVQMVINPVAIR